MIVKISTGIEVTCSDCYSVSRTRHLNHWAEPPHGASCKRPILGFNHHVMIRYRNHLVTSYRGEGVITMSSQYRTRLDPYYKHGVLFDYVEAYPTRWGDYA